MDVVDLLEGTRDYIDKYGWWQGNFSSSSYLPHRPVCPLGGLACVEAGVENPFDAPDDVFGQTSLHFKARYYLALATDGPIAPYAVVAFNDDRCSSKAEVITWFGRAIELARANERSGGYEDAQADSELEIDSEIRSSDSLLVACT